MAVNYTEDVQIFTRLALLAFTGAVVKDADLGPEGFMFESTSCQVATLYTSCPQFTLVCHNDK